MRRSAIALAAAFLLSGAAVASAQDATTPAPAPGSAGEANPAADTGQAGTMGSSQAETADTASPPSNAVLVSLDKGDAPVPQLNLMTSQVAGMTVIGSDDKTIGDVGSVLGDQKGTAQAVSVEVGGFLGLGEKTVILMLDDVKLDMGRLRTTLTKEEIEKLPDFGG